MRGCALVLMAGRIGRRVGRRLIDGLMDPTSNEHELQFPVDSVEVADLAPVGSRELTEQCMDAWGEPPQKVARPSRDQGQCIQQPTSAFQLPGNGASTSMSSSTVAQGGKGGVFKGEAPPPHAQPLPLILSPSAFIRSPSSRVDNVCQTPLP
ncbi:hypothetical protein Purlil1_12296 [Purpureocillium lilacinum]|uniref:Uncharacterized protein n=1 Tax=Purpureocillium lilacinum TaxID=33203 RepID=A0ABR0BHA7_PURLI|nr:hypothetical protein Purlil1_12296 [Purpureocillium lilacinum]